MQIEIPVPSDAANGACGTGGLLDSVNGFLYDALRESNPFYKEQALARLASQNASPGAVQVVEDRQHGRDLDSVVTAFLRLSRWDKEEYGRVMAQIRLKHANLNDESKGVNTAFDRVLTGLALDGLAIDTLILSLFIESVRVRDDHQLTVRVAKDASANQMLWRDENGVPIRGVCAIWDGRDKRRRHDKDQWDGLFVRIGPLRKGYFEVGCEIQFSVSALAGQGDNAWPVDGTWLPDILDLVQQRLSQRGLIVDVRQAKISRCDLNRNFVLDEPPENYESVWRAMGMPRARKHEHGSTGITSANKSQGVLLYDKIVERLKDGWATAHLPARLMRLEWQVKGARNVRRKLGIHSVQDLIDKWDTLPALFLTHMQKTLFRYDPTELRAPRPRADLRVNSPTHAQIRNLIQWCQRNGIAPAYKPSAARLDRILRTDRGTGIGTSGLDAYAIAVKAIPGMKVKHAHDAIRRMRKAFWREKVLTDPDFARRYEELRCKIEGGHW